MNFIAYFIVSFLLKISIFSNCKYTEKIYSKSKILLFDLNIYNVFEFSTIINRFVLK